MATIKQTLLQLLTRIQRAQLRRELLAVNPQLLQEAGLSVHWFDHHPSLPATPTPPGSSLPVSQFRHWGRGVVEDTAYRQAVKRLTTGRDQGLRSPG